MIICSCAVISDHDIEMAVLDIMSGPDAPIPTPGVVYRQTRKEAEVLRLLTGDGGGHLRKARVRRKPKD